MGLIIYFLGCLLCYIVLSKIRKTNSRKDIVISLLISLSSWLGFIIYGSIYLRFILIFLFFNFSWAKPVKAEHKFEDYALAFVISAIGVFILALIIKGLYDKANKIANSYTTNF